MVLQITRTALNMTGDIYASGNIGFGVGPSITYKCNVNGSVNATSYYNNNNLIDFNSYATNTNLNDISTFRKLNINNLNATSTTIFNNLNSISTFLVN